MSTSRDPLAVPRQDLPTVEGTAQVRVLPAAASTGTSGAAGTLLLGHGAGGQRDAADVLALTALTAHGWTVVLVDQPWRVAGRKIATPPPTLDRAWLDVVRVLAEGATPLPRPWVYGGRSAGARVAARTSVGSDGAPVEGVAGVLCLAFPLHPPGRPERSRADELALPLGAGLPTLVVQGERDPMGTPDEIRAAVGGETLRLHSVPGNHSPSRDLAAVTQHAAAFLTGLR